MRNAVSTSIFYTHKYHKTHQKQFYEYQQGISCVIDELCVMIKVMLRKEIDLAPIMPVYRKRSFYKKSALAVIVTMIIFLN